MTSGTYKASKTSETGNSCNFWGFSASFVKFGGFFTFSKKNPYLVPILYFWLFYAFSLFWKTPEGIKKQNEMRTMTSGTEKASKTSKIGNLWNFWGFLLLLLHFQSSWRHLKVKWDEDNDFRDGKKLQKRKNREFV